MAGEGLPSSSQVLLLGKQGCRFPVNDEQSIQRRRSQAIYENCDVVASTAERRGLWTSPTVKGDEKRSDSIVFITHSALTLDWLRALIQHQVDQ